VSIAGSPTWEKASNREVLHLADACLEHLLEAAETRLRGGRHRRAERLLPESGGGEQGVLLGMHADADVISATAKSVVVATRAAMAAAVGTVRHPERRPVVPGAQDPCVAGDHGADTATETVRPCPRRERDQEEVLIFARPVRGRSGHLGHLPMVADDRIPVRSPSAD